VSGLLTVVAAIPWGKVVDHTPKLLAAATKLADSVRHARVAKPALKESSGDPDGAAFLARIAALESRVTGLEEEVATASQLVKELAAANAALIQQTQRLMLLTAVGGVSFLLSLFTLAMLVWK
jgi:hypothetical protein